MKTSLLLLVILAVAPRVALADVDYCADGATIKATQDAAVTPPDTFKSDHFEQDGKPLKDRPKVPGTWTATLLGTLGKEPVDAIDLVFVSKTGGAACRKQVTGVGTTFCAGQELALVSADGALTTPSGFANPQLEQKNAPIPAASSPLPPTWTAGDVGLIGTDVKTGEVDVVFTSSTDSKVKCRTKVVVASAPAPSVPGCTGTAGAQLEPKQDDPIAPPTGFKVTQFTQGDKPLAGVPTPLPSTWNANLLKLIGDNLKPTGGAEIDLVFTSDDGKTQCKTRIVPSGASGNGGAAGSGGSGAAADGCEAQGEAWAKLVNTQVTGQRYTMIVFDTTGQVCYSNRLQGVMGDPIYIGIYGDPQITWNPIQMSPCSLEDTSPAILVGGDVSLSNAGVEALQKASLLKLAPRTCFNDHVDLKLTGTNSKTNYTAAMTLQQYTLYRATLQLGVLFSTNHTASFNVANNAAGNSVVHFSGDSRRGPEYVAALVLYGLPNYLTHLANGGPPYRGRDIINDDGILDRIGLVTGISVTDPTRRFVIGGSFELMYGFNLIVVDDFHRQVELDGISVGDGFTADASKIPTKNVWQQEVVFGISLDLRYVKELFGGHIKP